MRTQVAGGVRFIGSTLAAALLRADDEVVVVDNLHHGEVRPSMGKVDNVPTPSQTHHRFRWPCPSCD